MDQERFFHAFIGFGEKLLLPNPVYPLYLSKAKQFEGDAVFYRHDADGQIDVANLAKKIEGAKAMVIINPNNPTGSVAVLQYYEDLLEKMRERDVGGIFDKAYKDYTFDEHVKPVSITQVPELMNYGYEVVSFRPRVSGRMSPL
jgi:LL-diaminopimelate aminotransferase